MDTTTLNIDSYSDHELFDLFDIELENIHNCQLLDQKYDNVKLDLQMRYANENCTK